MRTSTTSALRRRLRCAPVFASLVAERALTTVPRLDSQALASGITTVIGGGTGPAAGTNATTCTPGQNYMQAMM